MNEGEVKAYEEDTGQIEEEIEEIEEEENITISLNAMYGSISSGTLRAKGLINGKDMKGQADRLGNALAILHSPIFVHPRLQCRSPVEMIHTTPLKIVLISLLEEIKAGWKK
ncbi:UNVERIFIED_CONTAM: hypothetical protein Sindi_1308000 [Sesamum indicum]